ncbi:MAG: OmpA family protein [Verrucomicrobiales bacterium]|nr:OmpA family protein [Verrucomicrobiales bacterium]
MRIPPLLPALLVSTLAVLHARETQTDGDWSLQTVSLRDTPEAEVMIRIGDIDNLGFGFADDFNPFTGRPTDPHGFPFDPAAGDAAGTDRIMVGSRFTGEDLPAGQDGYTFDYHPQDRPLKTESLVLPLAALAGVDIRDAVLCLFVDDFQMPTFRSDYQVTLNAVRFPEMERVLAALDQTGPVGKVLYIRLSQEMLQQLRGETLAIRVDDPTTGAGDGFAFDFAKLLVNVKAFPYLGTASGRVVDDETGEPIPGATVEIPGIVTGRAGADGTFQLTRIPAGLAVLSAGAPGYQSGEAPVDIIADEESAGLELRLQRSAAADFSGQAMRAGDRITLNKIQFDVNSAVLRPEGVAELDRVAHFLQQNPAAEIELSGHTSSEGGATLNRELSFRRVQSCKVHLAAAGIDPARITTIGHGPDQPVAPNDTEPNRALNRRVEMKVTRL